MSGVSRAGVESETAIRTVSEYSILKQSRQRHPASVEHPEAFWSTPPPTGGSTYVLVRRSLGSFKVSCCNVRFVFLAGNRSWPGDCYYELCIKLEGPQTRSLAICPPSQEARNLMVAEIAGTRIGVPASPCTTYSFRLRSNRHEAQTPRRKGAV